MHDSQPIQLIFDLAERGDVASLGCLLADNPAVVHVRNADFDTPLIVASRAGHAAAVEALLGAGSDPNALGKDLGAAISWAAGCGREDITRILARVTSQPITVRAASWAAAASQQSVEPVLAVLRALPSLTAQWREAGLPVERRDNFTMTQLRVRRSAVNEGLVAVARSESLIEAHNAAAERQRLSSRLSARELEVRRCGDDFSAFRFIGATQSSIHDHSFQYEYGFPIDSMEGYVRSGGEIRRAMTCACATSCFRGPYSQIGYAHALLRQMFAREGLTDACRELRETYHYWETPGSDYNQIMLSIVIEPGAQRT